MKSVPAFLAFLLLLSTVARAQQVDTIYHVALPSYQINDTRIWANDHEHFQYNQTRYYVTTILPYVLEATRMFHELNERLPELRGKARRDFVREQEALVRSRFEEKIVGLNVTQGVLLLKLVARQTGLNIYQQLADFKGGMAAMKWQVWARMHGFNLNRKYHPEEERLLEYVMEGLGYPLPQAYAGLQPAPRR
jgi:hypothetical protein